MKLLCSILLLLLYLAVTGSSSYAQLLQQDEDVFQDDDVFQDEDVFLHHSRTDELGLQLAAGTNSIEATWDVVPGASYYNISWTPGDNGGTDTVNAGNNTYTITGLVSCTVYTVTLQAMNETDAGDSANDTTTTQTKDSLGLSLSAGTEDITAHWVEVPGASSYTISWTPGDNGGTDTVDGGNNTKHDIKGLMPCTNYTVTVQAKNEIGNVGCSDTRNRDTKAKDSRAVTNLRVDTVGHNKTSLLASWTQPPQPGNCVVYYNISWSGGNLTNTDEQPNLSNYTIVDLTPCTAYVVGVTTRTSENYSISKNQNGSTTDYDATAPESFTSESIKTKKVTLSWSNPNSTCSVVSYLLSYGGEEVTVPASKHEYTVQGLKAHTEYTFTLKAETDYDGGGESVSLTITTKVDGVAIGVGVTVGILVVVAVAVAGYIYRDKMTCLKKTKKEQII